MQTDRAIGAGRVPDLYLPALDGLRFAAAIMVAGGHYTFMFPDGTMPAATATFTGLGMTLFFVLSGFVIHYNYHAMLGTQGGFRRFMVARLARLYPLYILLFLFELGYLVLTARSACGRAGEGAMQMAGLPYFLTFTQSWFYTLNCGKSLIYQYGPISAVSWSLSVELFFYLVYAAACRLGGGRLFAPSKIVPMAIAAFGLTLIYFWFCGANEARIDDFAARTFGPPSTVAAGYNDSFMRWLLYFNPAVRLSEFVAGVAAASLFLHRRGVGHDEGGRAASMLTFSAIALVLAVHLFLYLGATAYVPFIGRIASPLYGPLIAAMMYLVVRHATLWSRALSHPIAVRCGEASYSIYLLHEVFPSVWKRLGIEADTPPAAWALWALTLVLLIAVSRVSYRAIERPARQAVRRRLMA